MFGSRLMALFTLVMAVITMWLIIPQVENPLINEINNTIEAYNNEHNTTYSLSDVPYFTVGDFTSKLGTILTIIVIGIVMVAIWVFGGTLPFSVRANTVRNIWYALVAYVGADIALLVTDYIAVTLGDANDDMKTALDLLGKLSIAKSLIPVGVLVYSILQVVAIFRAWRQAKRRRRTAEETTIF